jgi:hypothetical protein
MGAALLVLGACTPSIKVDVTLVTRACLDPPAGAPLDPLDGVGFLRFACTSNGVALSSVVVPVGAGTVDLPSFAVGTGRIDVEGTSDESATAQVLSSGSSGDFQIPNSKDVKVIPLTIFLRRAGAFSWANGAATPNACSGLVVPRAYHTQVLLSDGRVLIYGGLHLDGGLDWTELLGFPPTRVQGATYLSSAEIYDPATGLFTEAGGWPDSSSVTPWRAQAASAAASEGAALLLGGESPAPVPSTALVFAANGERFAPDAGGPPWNEFQTASPHARGCLATDRDGQALLSGGYGFALGDGGLMVAVGDAPDPTSNPPTDQVVPDFPSGYLVLDGPLSAARAEQGCTGFSQSLAGDLGLLLYAGGARVDSAGVVTFLRDVFFYRYLPALAGSDGGFQPYLQPSGSGSGELPVTSALAQPRARPRIARLGLLEDGGASEGALVTGGLTCDLLEVDAGSCTLEDAELPPFDHFVGRGVGDGGLTLMNAARSTELIHFPGTTVHRDPGPDMLTERIEHCAVTLADGRVLILGGVGGSTGAAFGTQGSAEITSAVPGTPIPALAAVGQGLLGPRAGMACTLLGDGSVLVTGGLQTVGVIAGTVSQVQTLGSAEIFRVAPGLITTRH